MIWVRHEELCEYNQQVYFGKRMCGGEMRGSSSAMVPVEEQGRSKAGMHIPQSRSQ
jgi:hypothetical protein